MKTKSGDKSIISFRVNKEERDALLELARNSGLSLSQLMRRKLHVLYSRTQVD